MSRSLPHREVATDPPRGATSVEFEPSNSQRRLWFLDRLSAQSADEYINCVAHTLYGDIDCDALRAALSALVDRHDSLRMVFRTRRGEPVGCLIPPYDPRQS